MPDNDYQKNFILLVKKGEDLRKQLSSLKKEPVNENICEARAEILKYERLEQQIEKNLKEIQFTYYLMKAEDMK